MHNLWKKREKKILYEHPCYHVSKYKTSTHNLLQCNKKSFLCFSAGKSQFSVYVWMTVSCISLFWFLWLNNP